MDYIHIKPASKPVSRSEIEELSSSAVQVLHALQRRFVLYRQISHSHSVHQPLAPTCSRIDPPLGLKTQPPHGSEGNRPRILSMPDRESTLQLPQLFSDVSAIDRLHQSPNSAISSLHVSSSERKVFMPDRESSKDLDLRECSDSHQRKTFELNLSCEELSFEHEVPKLNSTERTLDMRRSSPLFDFSTDDSIVLSPDDKSTSESKSKNGGVINSYNDQENCRCSGWNDVKKTEHNENTKSAYFEHNVDNDDDNSLYDSVSSDEIEPILKRNSSIWTLDQSLKNCFSDSLEEHNPAMPSKPEMIKKTPMENAAVFPSRKIIDYDESDEEQSFQIGKGSSNLSEKPLSQNSSFTFTLQNKSNLYVEKNVVEKSDCEKPVSGNISGLEKSSEPIESKQSRTSLKNYQQSLGNKENTPSFEENSAKATVERVQKKYLGTPFQRALSSSCISNRSWEGEDCPHDDSVNQESDSLVIAEKDKTQLNFGLNSKTIVSTRDDKTAYPPLLSFEKKTNIASPMNYKAFNNESTASSKECKLYFPIFKPSMKTKRKVEDLVPTDTLQLQSSQKRKKFLVPFKKEKAVDKNPSCSLPTQDLTENFAIEIGDKIASDPPQETSLTILYREGFCQLDRPKTSRIYHPKSIMLRIAWSKTVQNVSIDLQEKHAWYSLFLRKLFADKTRKICFESQEMIQLLIDKFDFSSREVCSGWLVLDPLIGCWLLNPDQPPQSFREVCTFLKVPQGSTNETETLLSQLSHCAEALYRSLTSNGLWKLYLHIETRITSILASMELNGIQVDIKKIQDMAGILKSRLEDVQEEAYGAAGKRFQLTSPQQLSSILYDDLKLDKKHNIFIKETGKRHDKSTSESMLIKLKDLHPLPSIVLEFRRLHKFKSTYVDSLLSHVSGNRIYTTWDQTSAATGRITSNEPNLQTIPKQPLMPELFLRTAFVARNEYSLLAADFQHIELRVFAHLSKDASLVEALCQKNDVFKMLAKKLLQIQNIEEVSDEDREKTKKIVYAVIYGAGPSKLSELLHVDFNQACSVLNKFTDTFPKLQYFSKSILDQCRKLGYLATEAGRRRWFPNITSTTKQLRLYSERQAVNFLIQGTAADLCKCAMVHTQRHLSATGANILLQIHDELLWEVPDSEVNHVAEVVQEAMEGATSVLQSYSNFSVPLPVVIKVGKTWGAMNVLKKTSLGPASQQL